MDMSTPQIGCSKNDLDTPALCLDLDVMEANIQTMVETCRTHNVTWRPHAKCHKSPDIAKRLVQAGAIGVTCSTVQEAENMAAAGINDLLIANMIAGKKKIERLVALTSTADAIVCVDHLAQATAISEAMEAAKRDMRVPMHGLGDATAALYVSNREWLKRINYQPTSVDPAAYAKTQGPWSTPT